MIEELSRLPSPAARPHALAFDGQRLWVGSVETSRIYSIDPVTWMARKEGITPGAGAEGSQGKPWGMTVVGDELRVCYGIGDDDDRVIARFVPGHGFHGTPIACPDGTGSQLAYDGERLFLSQFYRRRILAIDESGAVGTVIEVPRGDIVGLTIVDGRFYVATTDDESRPLCNLMRIDARGPVPVLEDIATVPFPMRSLAFDGARFWTNHREAGEIVAFVRPDA